MVVAGCVLLASLAAASPPRASPSELRDQFEKADKLLNRSADAAQGHDPGRVSLLLRRADEEIGGFEETSGLKPFAAAVERSREEARRADLAAAEASLRGARLFLASLSSYIVPRSAEVAFRTALSAAADGNPHDFLAAVDRLESATLAPVLLESLRQAREAVARGRSMMVRSDLPSGRKEIETARTALQGVTYVATLSHAAYNLMVASELLGDGALLAARDLTQKGLRELRQALDLAPAEAKEPLRQAQEEATIIWRRINRPQPGDAASLAAAGDRIEGVRQALLASRERGAVSQ